MKNPHKALKAIEYLVGDDFGLDMEWLEYTDNKKEVNIVNKERLLLEAAKRIGKIYMIAHSEGDCEHPSWEKVKDEVILAYKDN